MSNIADAVRPAPTGPASKVATDDAPYITSSVNGMVIPLLPHQGGILHRFKLPGNTPVVDRIANATAPDDRRRMVMDSPLNASTAEEQAADQAAVQGMNAALDTPPVL